MSIQPTGSDAAGASGLGSQPMTVTPAAVEKVQEFASQNEEFAGKSFRVFVEGGGCSGFGRLRERPARFGIRGQQPERLGQLRLRQFVQRLIHSTDRIWRAPGRRPGALFVPGCSACRPSVTSSQSSPSRTA